MYTHSARRYLGRLLLFAVLSEIPYRLALRAGSLAFGLFNVFFTLLAGAACCQLVKFCRSKGRRWAWAAVAPVAAIVLLCEILGTDYGGFGVLCILLPYLFWESKPARIIALGSVVAFLYIVVNNFSGFSSPLWWVGNPAQFWYMAQQTVFALAGVGWWPCTTAARLEKRQVGVLCLLPRPPAGAVAAPRRRRFDHLLFRGGIFMKKKPFVIPACVAGGLLVVALGVYSLLNWFGSPFSRQPGAPLCPGGLRPRGRAGRFCAVLPGDRPGAGNSALPGLVEQVDLWGAPPESFVEFTCDGWGFGSSTSYYGFYYSPAGPEPFQGAEVELTPQNGGYAWQGEGDNWGVTRALGQGFYYFEVHF